MFEDIDKDHPMYETKEGKPLLKKKEPKKPKNAKQVIMTGVVSGFLNGLFGAGGGVLGVMFLRKIIGDERKAHASATLMILIMSIVSFVLYLLNGHIDFAQGLTFMPGGVIGAIAGAAFLKNINSDILRRIFGGVIAISGVVMLIR